MRVEGELTFSGDKSISHRALILGALTDGECTIENASTAEDVESTGCAWPRVASSPKGKTAISS